MSDQFNQKFKAGEKAFKMKDYEAAEAHLKEALQIAEDEEDLDSEVLCCDKMAELYFEQGRFSAAEPLYQRALEIR